MNRKLIWLLGLLMLTGLGISQTYAATISTASVNSVSDGSQTGAAQLVRADMGLELSIMTSKLDSNHAYSVWWVVFSHNGTIVRNATGGVVGGSGKIGFAAHLGTGITPVADGVSILGGGGVNFDDPLTATVVIVIHDHGPFVPGLVSQEIATFTVGCSVSSGGDGSGIPYDCIDAQFSVLTP